MDVLHKIALAVAPRWSMQRERARLLTMNYRAARLGGRSDALRPSKDSADRAAARRDRIAAYVRDLIRNTPFAARGQEVIANNVVGDGILPKIEIRGAATSQKAADRLKEIGLQMIEDHLDTVKIDADGLLNLYGLQRLAVQAIVSDGEVLIRRHRRFVEGGAIPLQIEVMEADYLDASRYGGALDGGLIQDGIEYDQSGRRVAYWLYTQHPGGDYLPNRSSLVSERVPAEDVLHIFRVDRPGQKRGVSWFTTVAEKLLNLDDYEDAQIMRQKIAACFAAFRKVGSEDGKDKVDLGGAIEPGTIYDIAADDEMVFGSPPEVAGYDEFTRTVLRAAAVGLNITYEAFTGDLTGVNFSSARIGRVEMDRSVSGWQWLMMIPMMMQPLGGWIMDAWEDVEPALLDLPERVSVSMQWVPPVRILVDPAREISALKEAVRAGFQSRQGVVRQLGVDPERLLAEQGQDKQEADALGLYFDSDPRADVSRQIALSREKPSEGLDE